MTDEIPFRHLDSDEVDLIALRHVLREAQIVVVETCDDAVQPEYQEAIDRTADRQGTATCGRIAAQSCVKYEGQKSVRSDYRAEKQRRYTMYAMHPDTAEQAIKAIELLIERFGPRFLAPTRATKIAPRTVRAVPPQET